MPPQNGLLLSYENDNSADAVELAIRENGVFTATISASLKPRLAEIALISLTGEFLDYIGISRKGSRIATGTNRITVSNLASLDDLAFSSIYAELPKKHRGQQLDVTKHRRISPKLWQAILVIVQRDNISIASHVGALKQLIAEIEEARLRRHGGIEIFERDAIATSIQIFGGTRLRKQTLRSVTPTVSEHAPFIKRLKQVSLREDAQIIQDSSVFPGMILKSRHVVGSVELINAHGEKLTILNCNRQPLEETLGVDLIYYSHKYHSFILIQYKRMSGRESGTASYRPKMDKNYASELSRMNKLDKILSGKAKANSSGSLSFRLSEQSLFFKFCEMKTKAALDEGMVSGMYIPLRLWNNFMDYNELKGTRGGIAVNWQNAPRYLNNSEFTSLIKSGWVGSCGSNSHLLSSVIEKVLDNKHMLLLAATSAAASHNDYNRDSLGRFASDNDPYAER